MSRWALAVPVLLAATFAAAAQLDRPGGRHRTDVEYDGRFTFVRLRWASDLGTFRRGGWSSAWNHDLPRAEQNLTRILAELTDLDVRTNGSRILALDDPDLYNYPVAFMWEPGFWQLREGEASAFREWLLKGGFAVFEDFDGPRQWAHFDAQMQRVLPGARLVRLDNTHAIFNTFFEIAAIDAVVHPMYGLTPSYYGIFEDNDPAKRLMVVANFDNDVPEYWEWSGEGLYPFDASNEAYKLGVNYVIYGLTR